MVHCHEEISLCLIFSQNNLAQWLSWLERRPVTAEVTGSSPVWVVQCSQSLIDYLCTCFLRSKNFYASAPYGQSLIDYLLICFCQANSYADVFYKQSQTGYLYGILAQLGEHLPYKQRVIGSSPIGPIMSDLDF